MFCKWCGKKITNNGVPCPSCGKTQDALESGNGFWDLCSSKLEVSGADVGAVPIDGFKHDVTETKATNKNDTKNNSTKHTKTPFVSYILSAISIQLLLILIIEVGVGMHKTAQCLDQFSTISYGISDITGNVNNRFDELLEYLTTQDAENIQFSDDTNSQELEESAEIIDIEALLKSDDISFLRDKGINIERYKIDSDYAGYVYIASGDRLTAEEARIYWQKSTEATEADDSWETIASEDAYLVVNGDNEARYRILCIEYDEHSSNYVCYYATTDSIISDSMDSEDEEVTQESSVEEKNQRPIDEKKGS